MSLKPASESSDPAGIAALPESSEGTSSTLDPSPPAPSTTVLRSLSDPLPSPPIAGVHPKNSATSLQTFSDAASRAIFKYPRFSTATSLAETGGPGFSMEELTSTEVSEDEDAIIRPTTTRSRGTIVPTATARSNTKSCRLSQGTCYNLCARNHQLLASCPGPRG